MERSNSLLGQYVGLGAVLQQHVGDFHLILLSGDVKRRVAVLIFEDRKLTFSFFPSTLSTNI